MGNGASLLDGSGFWRPETVLEQLKPLAEAHAHSINSIVAQNLLEDERFVEWMASTSIEAMVRLNPTRGFSPRSIISIFIYRNILLIVFKWSFHPFR